MRCAQDQVPEIPAVDPEGEERHVDDVNGGVLPKEEVEKARLRCGKSARRCGTKHISKSKCTKDTMLGPLLEVEMSKKCTLLWREAHFQIKMYKALQFGSTFGSCDVGVWSTFGRSDAVSRGRRRGLCTLPKVSKT